VRGVMRRGGERSSVACLEGTGTCSHDGSGEGFGGFGIFREGVGRLRWRRGRSESDHVGEYFGHIVVVSVGVGLS